MKNTTEVIKNTEKLRILRLLNCSEEYIDGRASDFEWFDMWERTAPLAAGHSEIKKYAEELSRLGLSPVGFSEYSKKESIRRWRRVSVVKFVGTFEDELPVNIDICEEKLSDMKNFSVRVGIEGYVADLSKCCERFSELSARARKAAEDIENAYITLAVNIKSDVYVRPDPHTAETVFQKLKRDEALNCVDTDVLLLQLMTELIIGLKQYKKITVELRSKTSNNVAYEYIKYIFRRKIFEGEARLAARDSSELEGFAEVAEGVYPKIWLRPLVELEDGEKPNTSELLGMFSVYPAGAFCFENGGKSEALQGAFEAVCDGSLHIEYLRRLTEI